MRLRDRFFQDEDAYITNEAAPFGLKTALSAVNGLERALPTTPMHQIKPDIVHLASRALDMFSGDHPAIEAFGAAVSALCTTDMNGNKGLKIGAHGVLLSAFNDFNQAIAVSPGIEMTEKGKARSLEREQASDVYYSMGHGVASVSFQLSQFDRR